MALPELPFNEYILRELIEVAEPAVVSWLPQTLGWKLVLVAVLITLCWRIGHYLNWRWKNRYRDQALHVLQHLDRSDTDDAAAQVFHVLKITACHAFGNAKVARLTGADWLNFLEQHAPGLFNTETGNRWQQGLLRPNSENALSSAELEQLITASCIWLKQHNAEAGS